MSHVESETNDTNIPIHKTETSYCIAQGTLLNIMWQPGWDRSLRGYRHIIGWVPQHCHLSWPLKRPETTTTTKRPESTWDPAVLYTHSHATPKYKAPLPLPYLHCFFLLTLYWRIVHSQHGVSYRRTANWISYTYTYMHFFRFFSHYSSLQRRIQ